MSGTPGIVRGMNTSRWRPRLPKKMLAAGAVLLLAAGGAAASSGIAHAETFSCTTSSPTGACPAGGGGYTNYAGFSDFSSQMNFGSPYADANEWGQVSGETQTLSANSPGDWQVAVNIPASSNPSGAVTTYPNGGFVLNNPPLTSYGDITSAFADSIPTGSGNSGWQGYDNWFNNWADEIMIQTNFVGNSPCTYAAVQQFGGVNGVPVQTWGLCDFGSEKVWKLAPSGTQAGGSATVSETSGSVDVTAMTDWLITHGYMTTSTPASTTVTALSAGFEICETAGTTTWSYSNLTFVNNTGGGGGTQQAPLASTSAATNVTSSGATLNGSVNPEGAATSYKFDYGTTASYGSSTPAGSAGSGTSAVNENAVLTGLSPSTVYHYRIEAANSGGTTDGSDQTFTTPAAGGGGTSVAFDASAGARNGGSSPLSWTQTVGSGANRALLADITIGSSNDIGCAPVVKDNGVTMTEITAVHDNNQRAGGMAVFGLANPPSGTNTITASVTGCSSAPSALTGGSESFTGVSQSAPFGAHAVSAGAGTVSSVSLSAPAGDLTGEFASDGSSVSSAQSPVVSKFIENQNFSSGAGNTAGGYEPGNGASQAGKWTMGGNDWWGAAAVDIAHA